MKRPRPSQLPLQMGKIRRRKQGVGESRCGEPGPFHLWQECP